MGTHTTQRPWGASAVAGVEGALGYRFTRPQLAVSAITHATYVNECAAAGEDYQRLEFLGDAVLDLLVSEALYTEHPSAQEGLLSRWRAAVVREAALAEVAEAMALGPLVRLGQGQAEAGCRASILADVLEALMAAVYLDGGLAACCRVFLPHLRTKLQQAAATGEGRDAKTQLQELCHRRHLPTPHYKVVAEHGPSHARRFEVELIVPPWPSQRAQASSKKVAEQSCARQLLASFEGVAFAP